MEVRKKLKRKKSLTTVKNIDTIDPSKKKGKSNEQSNEILNNLKRERDSIEDNSVNGSPTFDQVKSHLNSHSFKRNFTIPKTQLKSPLSKKSKMNNSICEQDTIQPLSNCENHNLTNLNNLSLEDNFEKFGISNEIIDGLNSIQIFKPNDVQKKIFDQLIKNDKNDIYIRSLPYSGDKMAILIKLFQYINPDSNRTQCIWVASTNEISSQFGELAKQITQNSKINVQYLTRENQSFNEKICHHLVISPIGTLLYCIKNGDLDIDKVKYLFIDEVDLFLNSFENKERLNKLTKQLRKFMFFIISPTLEDWPFDYLKRFGNFIKLNLLSSINEYFTNLLQFRVVYKNNYDRWNGLMKIIKNSIFNKIIIFATGVKVVKLVYFKLIEESTRFADNVSFLSSELSTDERIETLKKFETSKMHIISAISPLMNGTNLGDEPCMLINYDLYMFERSPNDYLNRISCCLKFTRPGFVINFDDVAQSHLSKLLENHFNTKFIDLDLSDKNH